MKMRLLTPLVIALLPLVVFAQNIVPNGDFEVYSWLPSHLNQSAFCNGWLNPTEGSPDYYHTSGLDSVELPNAVMATVFPFSGDAIMGFITGGPSDYREYIACQLLTPMTIGETYYVSFWLTNGMTNHKCGYSSNNIGMRFTTEQLMLSSTDPLGGTPQIEISDEVWALNWKQYTFIYVAGSSYNFLTIGNFQDANHTSSSPQVISVWNFANYFIDKVEVVPIPKLEIIGNETICLGDSTTLIGVLDSQYSWVAIPDINTVLSNDAQITVSPDVTTVYLLFSSSDSASFVVHVEPPPTIYAGDDVTICLGESLKLEATTLEGNNSVFWQYGPDMEFYEVSPTENALYTAFAANEYCVGSDTVMVAVDSIANITPVAYPDSIVLSSGFGAVVQLDLTENDSLFDLPIWVTLTTNIEPGGSVLDPNGWLAYTPVKDFIGQPTHGVYRLCNQICPTLCSEATVTINYPRRFIIITPNGDGLNENFVLPELFGNPSNQLTIINRWGSVVYEAKPYQNDWHGQNKLGDPLPEATYYFVLKYDIPGASVLTGAITVKR